MGWPSALDKADCAVRVMASTPEPVALGSTKRTGLSDCASAGSASVAVTAASVWRRVRVKRFIGVVSRSGVQATAEQARSASISSSR
jgi:hypothetical protein